MELNTLLASPFVLPSIPRVIALLLSELMRDEPDLKAISQLISTDPALTTRLLQTANAPEFGMTGRVGTVTEALAILALPQIRGMAADAASAASLKSVPGLQLQRFWAYSLNVAKLARSLAGVVKQHPGLAFTSGLIHGIGELVMHAAMPQEMAPLDREVPTLDLRRDRAEYRALGYCYGQVGAAFAQRWNFPQPVVDAIEHQCEPFDNNAYEPLAGVVHLAVWRARARESRYDERQLTVSFPAEVAEVMRLDIDMVLQQDPIAWRRRL